MKKVKVEDAIGLTICHDITAMYDGFKGAAFKRGHVITEEDIPKLLDYGKKHIFVWEDEQNEIHEEDAALRLYEMTKIDNTRKEGPSEGKILVFAECDGFFKVDEELLSAINNVGVITIATLPNHYRVEKGGRLASMRIVPLVCDKAQIEKAESLCKGKKVFDLIPYKHKKVGIVITGSEVYSGRIKDKFEAICRKKLENYPCDILKVSIVDDDLDMIKKEAKSMLDMGCDLIAFSGGMSVDPDDLTPTAIKELGAEIITYGVPSQPGNMTLVSYIGDKALIGVPGAAISMPTTVFDVLLPQIFADIKWTKKDLTNLATGGLCQLCKPCHFPNCTFGKY